MKSKYRPFDYLTSNYGTEVYRLINVKNLKKSFDNEDIINISEFTFEKGKSYIIFGPSGCGKSTLLNIIAGVITSDSGGVIVNDLDITKLSPVKRDDYRLKSVGYVFQDFRLLDNMTVEDNLRLLELEIKRKFDVDKMLDALGILAKKNKKVTTLSVGEKQRVAIARALIKDPLVLLADEPTGNLNLRIANEIMSLIAGYAKKLDIPVIAVSHNYNMKEYFDVCIEMSELNRGVVNV